MCGIAGTLYFDPARRADPAVLERMSASLRHRGPDDAGVHVDGPLGLVHRRLSIVDLSPLGHQPMTYAGGAIVITFNGEIYNHLELRAALERDGVAFRSRSDTEVLLALYEREGLACLQRLRGMFAFALWDARRRSLILARDRVGKKPLHYYLDGERLVFASEPRALFEDPEVPLAADLPAIHQYLTFGYVPTPRSAFRGVRKLPPAHVLVVQDGRARLERYWALRYTPKRQGREADLAEEMLAELRESVRLRMIADVPVGAFLSGGLDSSTIVALMSEQSSRPIKTFSIGFEEAPYNELAWARQVAARYATDHHEFVVKPDPAILDDLVWHYSEPYADSSAIPMYYLAQMTRQHVTVALSGDAGDENFAGYDRYLATRVAGYADYAPAPLRRALARHGAGLAALVPSSGVRRRLRRFLPALAEDPRRRYAAWVTLISDAEKAGLYADDFRAATAGETSCESLLAAYATVDAEDFVEATAGVDVATYLPDDLLVKVDIATMAHALEARAPMVDHVFMEFVASLPASLKLRGWTSKYLLKRAVRGRLLPPAIVDRPKRGFGVPIDAWFRGPLAEMAHDVLLGRPARERGLFATAGVERLLDDHRSGRRDTHPQLWGLLMLELWFTRFIDARGKAARS